MKSTSRATEHILAYGLYGSGKTHAWATIANEYRKLGMTNKFYVIGTEYGALDRLSDGYPDFDANVVYQDVADWTQLTAATGDYLTVADAGDWLVIEGIDKAWHYVQNLYDQLHGEPLLYDPNDPFAMEKGMPDGSQNRDWVRINGVYRGWINSILRSPAHVFACSPQDAIKIPTGKKGEWADSKEMVEQYSRFGFRPAGQKELSHHFHSILWCKNPSYGKWTLTSVDDHTRKLLDNQEVSNFTLDYLVSVAGWTL